MEWFSNRSLRVGHRYFSFLLTHINFKLWLLLTGAISLGTYILLPSIYQDKSKMFSKRIDKYTTGMRNPKNDCFANSVIQMLSASNYLINYLNLINQFHQDFIQFHKSRQEEVNKKNENLIPLHHELSMYIYKLNAPVTSTTVIGVRPFLRVIEGIYNSKISSNQHDAQELLQIILQTLETEYLDLVKLVSHYKETLTKGDDSDSDITKFLDGLVIPNFPFHGFSVSQLTCLSCLQKSSLSKVPVAIISLPVPTQREITLDNLIAKNQSENINDYSCLNCKIKAILKVEKPDSLYYQKLRNLENFCKINDDLDDKDLENYIDTFDKHGLKSANLRSTIMKNNYLIKLPQILTIHLSRSIFENNLSTKNTCRVKFDERVNLRVNRKIYHEYKMQESVEEDDLDSMSTHSSDSIDLTTELIKTIKNMDLEDDHSVQLIEFNLKAAVNHSGSHYYGHYQCYKKKPMYYKSASKIINKSPIIDLSNIEYDKDQESDYFELKNQFEEDSQKVQFDAIDESISDVIAVDIHGKEVSSEQLSDIQGEPQSPEQSPEPVSSISRSSSRRRANSIRAKLNPLSSSKQGSSTSLSAMRNASYGSLNSLGFSDGENGLSRNSSLKNGENERKLPSTVKKPFWKISDVDIDEVTETTVLNDSASIYMILYEKS